MYHWPCHFSKRAAVPGRAFMIHRTTEQAISILYSAIVDYSRLVAAQPGTELSQPAIFGGRVMTHAIVFFYCDYFQNFAMHVFFFRI